MDLPNGTKTATEIISDLRVTVCVNQGNRLQKFMLSKVRYSLKNKINLFSFTKRLMNGWDLGENRKEIWLINNGQTIKFDTKIKTKEGITFAMYVNRELPTQEVTDTCADCRMKFNINKAH